MSEFAASNGYVVSVIHQNRVVLHNEDGEDTLSAEFMGNDAHLDSHDMHALREFFQAEADERLGRWRWPENPDYVVYTKPDDDDGSHRMIREPDGEGWHVHRDWVYDHELGDDAAIHQKTATRAARAFFDAHPEPKPWHDAKPGEVWLLEMDGSPVLVEAGTTGAKLVFWPITGKPGSTSQHKPVEFTAGRRIFPEAVAS